MIRERIITTYKNYFLEFISALDEDVSLKIFYTLDILKTQDRISKKFVKYIRDNVYELRTEYEGNIYRIFFCFDKGNVVILFNGFQKKTQKTPEKEINRAIQLKNEYYANKR
ncbi:type II toxin-antitoxin system RelE/ParE family toxin [Viscerimonas tarda]